MPTLITELTPLQRMWLYENQLTRGDSRDSYEERWTRMGTSYSSDIFRERQQLPELEPPPPQPRMRKRRYEEEFCIHISPRHVHQRLGDDDDDDGDEAHAAAIHAPPPRHQAHSRGPNFPFHGDKLTWQQSLENLKVYRDHYGNCNVPQKYSINPKLGRWINKQRKKKKNPDKYGALTVEQVEQLEDLGFTWNQAP